MGSSYLRVQLDIEEPHHGHGMLSGEGDFCYAVVEFEFTSFFVDCGSPVR